MWINVVFVTKYFSQSRGVISCANPQRSSFVIAILYDHLYFLGGLLRGVVRRLLGWGVLLLRLVEFFLKYFLVQLGVYHIALLLSSGVH